jgi:hypothetical protein
LLVPFKEPYSGRIAPIINPQSSMPDLQCPNAMGALDRLELLPLLLIEMLGRNGQSGCRSDENH